jgi:hypothetical protein
MQKIIVWGKLNENSILTRIKAIISGVFYKNLYCVTEWLYFSVSGSPGAGERIGYFRYDACRAPYRIAVDYLWNGNEEAKEWCTKISNWAFQQGPSTIVDGYNLDGSRNGSNHTSSFVGGFGVAAMCNSQETVDAFGEELDELRDNRWFNLRCRCCYPMALTGNQWKPGVTGISPHSRAINASETMHTTIRMIDRSLVISGANNLRSVAVYTLSGKKAASFSGTSEELSRSPARGRTETFISTENGYFPDTDTAASA